MEKSISLKTESHGNGNRRFDFGAAHFAQSKMAASGKRMATLYLKNVVDAN